MNTVAYSAIESAWYEFEQVRALTPWINEGVGVNRVVTPGYYRQNSRHCVCATIVYDRPLSADDVDKLRNASRFINRSFVIAMSAILEAHGIVPNRQNADTSVTGGLECQLVKSLRHCFAHHGDAQFDPTVDMHARAGRLQALAFPSVPIFELPIDTFLEPLKNKVLDYIRAAT